MDHKFLLPTLMDAIFKFHRCGFEISGVVCDGAAPNLTMIKELTGAERRACGYMMRIYSVRIIIMTVLYSFCDSTDSDDKFEVKTWFLNPYTDKKVHFVICPSHQVITESDICSCTLLLFYSLQLKNMVSALFQSRSRTSGGTRDLKKDGTSLGWKTLQDMY